MDSAGAMRDFARYSRGCSKLVPGVGHVGKGRGGRGCHLRCDCATSALCPQQRFDGLLAAHPSGMLHKPVPPCIKRRLSA